MSTHTQDHPSPNIITCKCFYGGNLLPKDDTLEYMSGSCDERTMDIYELTLKKVNDITKELYYGKQSSSCFYLIKGVGMQILCDEETLEELRIEGVTHGAIELYFDGESIEEINVSVDFSDENNLSQNREVEVGVTNIDMTEIVSGIYDENEVEDNILSDSEKVIDNQEAGSSDDEFIDVQEMKKQWISKRNASGKNQNMRHIKERTQSERVKGLKDDYWGEDEYDYNSTQVEQLNERESDDEGPLSLSDDDENLEVHGKCEWPMYDHNTPFGSVQIELGQLFDKVEVLRKALVYYSCQSRHAWNYCQNEQKRVLVKCKFYPKCKWKISARYTKEYGCLQIRFFKDIHTCAPTKSNKRANAIFFAEEYQEKLLKHPTWKLKLFIKDVEETYGVKISRWQASSAKKHALSSCAKVVEKQYESLRDYMFELTRSNQGTSVFLALKPHISRPISQFHMFYISFLALRKGFLNGCRRVLGLDGAFLKGYCKGELLCATARDANNQMFPVAWAVVESESKESWSWFLEHLIIDLGMETGKQWTLLSDQQKGLVPTIAKLLPDAEHRLCARHIFTNWIKVIKGAPLHKLFWRAVKSYIVEGFNDAMNELKQRSSKAHVEMCSRDVTKFYRCFYKRWASAGVTCNNMAETFNSWILEAREKPILSMLEEIRRKVMSRMVEKKVQATKCSTLVTPRIRATIVDHMQLTRNWKAIEANQNVYEVEHVHNSTLTFAVRLDESTCTCRYWDVNGIPCEHATTAICSKNENPESYVAFWYTKEAYERSYSFSLEPLNGQSLWKKVDGSSILPSDPRVKGERPPNKRKRSYGEGKRKTYTYRIPKGGKQFCSKCKDHGHKSRTCKSEELGTTELN